MLLREPCLALQHDAHFVCTVTLSAQIIPSFPISGAKYQVSPAHAFRHQLVTHQLPSKAPQICDLIVTAFKVVIVVSRMLPLSHLHGKRHQSIHTMQVLKQQVFLMSCTEGTTYHAACSKQGVYPVLAEPSATGQQHHNNRSSPCDSSMYFG